MFDIRYFINEKIIIYFDNILDKIVPKTKMDPRNYTMFYRIILEDQITHIYKKDACYCENFSSSFINANILFSKLFGHNYPKIRTDDQNYTILHTRSYYKTRQLMEEQQICVTMILQIVIVVSLQGITIIVL